MAAKLAATGFESWGMLSVDMKALFILPVAYLADVQGFLLFAPYITLFLSLALYLRVRNRAAAAVPVRA